MTELYLSNSCFLIILLTILFLRIWSYIEWKPGKTCALVFVGAVQLYILADALFVKCFLDASVNVTVFRTVVLCFYLIYVTMPYIWHLFMQNYMGISCKISLRILESLPFFVLIGMILYSVPTGIIWSIDNSGTYFRGSLFGLFALLNLFYYFFAFLQTFYILLTKNTRGIKYLLESSVFSAVPLIGILVNTYVIPLYGVYPFQPYCLVIGVLLTYLFMVEHQKNQLESEHRRKLSSALLLEKEASKKALAAGAAKNTFLANMSHDIRTPMNAILGFSDIIAKHPDDEAIVRDAIAKIHTSGDILLRIINDVLDLSKIESGKLHLEESVINLTQMADNLQMMFEYSMKKGNISFSIVSNIKDPYVWCDGTKLQQILVNVINNAVKFTPKGGKITLTYEQHSTDTNLAEYRISVKDTGIGMDEEFQKHAFEAFERERTSTESKTEGTGLGLAIVKKLTELMNGQVTLNSKPGQGTEIQLCLPLKIASEKEAAETEHDADTPQISLSGMHVLLVEDNELNAEIALEILKNAGLSADWAEDGIACIEKLEKADAGYYQLILMDIQMPRLNGYETTKKIRRLGNPQKADIPIIAMTANAFDDDRRSALEAGMNGFVSKPIEVEKMMKTIAEVCR